MDERFDLLGMPGREQYLMAGFDPQCAHCATNIAGSDDSNPHAGNTACRLAESWPRKSCKYNRYSGNPNHAVKSGTTSV